jgi:phosphoserine phosphatase RsbU/P
MISKDSIQDKKELEIYSLLDLSKAINENRSVEYLFSTFERLMKAAMKIEQLALFVRDSDWKCEVNFGTSESLAGKVAHSKILEIHEECQILTGYISNTYDQFSLVLPIHHKDEILAYLLLGGFVDEDDLPLFLDLPFVRTFTNILVVAIENMRLAEREKQKLQLDKEMWIAREVQLNLIPKSFPNTKELRIQAKYLPHTQIGGDYYDFVESDEGIHVCLADVSGKGVPAALFMSNVQATFRVLVRQGLELGEIIHELNRILVHNGKGSLYVSIIMAYYNRKKRLLSYINAGHLPGICSIDGSISLMDKGTTVLGEFEKLPFLEKSEIMAEEVKILFYSDGLTEARNPEGEEYGMERVLSVFKKESQKDPKTQIRRVMNSLNDFRAETILPDDLTLLCCHIKE